MRRLARSFFAKPTLWVAKAILGKYLVRQIRLTKDKLLVGRIVETEAYIGPEDRASHAYKGKLTPRNRAEWMIGGHIYIYLVYGMYWQFNISTGPEGSPECVLIRALEPITTNGHEYVTNYTNKNKISDIRGEISEHSWLKVANGPGKLCRWLKLDKSFYGEDVTKSKRIWLIKGTKIGKGSPYGRSLEGRQIAKGPRIGIDYAGPIWAKKPWRFYLKNNPYVSRQSF